MPEPERRPIKSADRALTIIDFAAQRRSFRFAEVVDELDLPRSSAHGLVSNLVHRGWLEHDEDSRTYRLGLRAWFVGQQYDGHHDIARIATPYMERLRDELGETVQLARLDGIENVYIAISESRRPMRLASSVGMRLHAHATGIGKAMLAQLEPAEARERLSEVALPSITGATITDVDLLLAELATIREDGFAVDEEEYLEGCRCVAVPVYDDGRGLIVAISVSAPSNRCGPEWPEEPRRQLGDAARAIRSRLLLSLGVRETD